MPATYKQLDRHPLTDNGVYEVRLHDREGKLVRYDILTCEEISGVMSCSSDLFPDDFITPLESWAEDYVIHYRPVSPGQFAKKTGVTRAQAETYIGRGHWFDPVETD